MNKNRKEFIKGGGPGQGLSGASLRSGFTLLELLVVVLIIGILASIALPQYRKAVEKSKATQAIAILRTLGQAVVAHRMAAGTTPESFDELDVGAPAWTGTTKWNTADSAHLLDTRSNDDWSLQLYKDSTGAIQVYMGRLSGKYRGAGFIFQATDAAGNFTDNLLCAERKSGGITFDESLVGAYCKSIFKATPMESSGTSTVYPYEMP